MGRFVKTPCIIAALITVFAACASREELRFDRSQLIAGLQHEMTSTTQWLRVHAAEGLLDNGETGKIAQLFRAEATTAAAPYRIGAWRVLARATMGEERNNYIKRIREAMRDPQASDRVSAAESLGKLDAASRSDREVIFEWLKSADDATAAFPRWLLVLTSNPSERAQEEANLARLLNSPDPVSRLRAAFALGRLRDLSSESVAKLREQLKIEPVDSIARIYLITAVLLHTSDAQEIAELENRLASYAKGKANEQLEAGIATGLLGRREGLGVLKPMLSDPEPDARIGAANGMLKLLK